MAAHGRAERLRATPMLVTLAALQLAAVAVFLLNVAGQRTPVALGWLPVIGSGVLAGLSCRRPPRRPGSTPAGCRARRSSPASARAGDARDRGRCPAGGHPLRLGGPETARHGHVGAVRVVTGLLDGRCCGCRSAPATSGTGWCGSCWTPPPSASR